MPLADASRTDVGRTDVHPAMVHIQGSHATPTTTATTSTTITTTTTKKGNHDVRYDVEDNKKLYEHFHPLPTHPITPINVHKLNEYLVGHPDNGAVQFITDGLTHGFDYQGTYSSTRPRDLMSARNNAAAVSATIRKELERGHTSGQFRDPPFLHTDCSPIGAVEKPDGSHRQSMKALTDKSFPSRTQNLTMPST